MRSLHAIGMTLALTAMLLSGCAAKGGQMNSAGMAGKGIESQRLDLANFIGERLHLPATQPAHISRLRLNLIFPAEHKLLAEAHPNVALYSGDGRLLWQHEIEENEGEYVVNRKLSSPVFYAKVGVYYCKQGDQGLCMIQNVLYEINSSDRLPSGPLTLEYQLPASYF